MKYLVTGAGGFIGMHLCNALTARGDEVIVMDNLSAGQHDVKYSGDVRTDKLPLDIDGVFHLAAHIGTKSIIDSPFSVMNDNILMMQNIINYYENTGIKILYTSTTEVVMGIDQPRPTPETAPVGWDCPLTDRWAYSFSKYVAEEMLKKSSCDWVISRFGNVYGPRMCQDYVIKAIIRRILLGEDTLKVYSPMDTRTFCYVDDIVSALIKMMDEVDEEVINLAYPESITIRELYQKIIDVIGADVKLEIQPQLGKIEHRLLDISKADKIMGWKPTTSLDEGLLKTWLSYKHEVWKKL